MLKLPAILIFEIYLCCLLRLLADVLLSFGIYHLTFCCRYDHCISTIASNNAMMPMPKVMV